MIKTALNWIVGKRFFIYAGLAIAGVSFAAGAWSGWSVKSYFSQSATIKDFKENVEISEEIRNAESAAIDGGLLRNDILHNGKY